MTKLVVLSTKKLHHHWLKAERRFKPLNAYWA